MSTTSPSFADLGVPERICDALERRDITEPFDIQAATLVDALAGRDVLGRAPTGSGKTLAFGIPIVVDLPKAKPRRPTALILSPTRELADQIQNELASFAKPARVGVVYGGVGYGKQIRSLQQGVDVLVACPGRLEDLIERGDVSLGDVGRVVLDEADRMADMGFVPAVRRILDQTNDERQTVLFSATLDGDVAKLTRDYQHDPVRHEVGESTPNITLADHLFWKMEQPERTEVAALALAAEWPAIVFCRTRHGCDRLKKQLGKLGVDAVAIHGGRSQNQRTRALDAFATSRAQALIATDVAARGIHVDGVALVVHFDPPEDYKTYVHRSGRTARAGAGGVVLSFVTPEQCHDAKAVMRKLDLAEPITAPDVEILRSVADGGETPDMSRDIAPQGRGPKASKSNQRKSHGSGRGRRPQNKNGKSNNKNGQGGSRDGQSSNKKSSSTKSRNGQSTNKNGQGGSRNGQSTNKNGQGGSRNGQSSNKNGQGGSRNGQSSNKNGQGGSRKRNGNPNRTKGGQGANNKSSSGRNKSAARAARHRQD